MQLIKAANVLKAPNNMAVEQGCGQQLWKEWKKGGCKELYLQAKKDSKRAVYAAKKTAEEGRFGTLIETIIEKKY